MTSPSLTPRLGELLSLRQINIVLTAPRSGISDTEAD